MYNMYTEHREDPQSPIAGLLKLTVLKMGGTNIVAALVELSKGRGWLVCSGAPGAPSRRPLWLSLGQALEKGAPGPRFPPLLMDTMKDETFTQSHLVNSLFIPECSCC